ncbi:MAG: 50S ribosome-binding GTPase [Pirellulaceae bacterium]|nr:50S ribosome-binding GTPase [Pirellulaceae bacterium]
MPTDSELEVGIQQLREKTPVPTIWMFGKTGSGKSSIVRYLTGAESATVGEGFRPETKASKRYDFPDSLDPLLTFVDTRGLGEVDYQPDEDIARFSKTSELMVVTVRVADHALECLLQPLRRIRKKAPQRPVLLVLSCLHEVSDAIDISEGEDPFETPPLAATTSVQAYRPDERRPSVPEKLQTLIDEKVAQFAGLHDVVVPIDLTRPEDGFAEPNFGGQRLKHTILEFLPLAYRQSLLTLNESARPLSSRQKRARWQVLASSALAATAGAVPLPWVDIPAVLGIQAHLAVRISRIYDQEITTADWTMLSSAAGSRIALRMALREALKFIPMVGMAVGAASSFAFTYALGMTWDWYFASKRGGSVPSAASLKQVFAEQLKRGNELWRAT